MHNSYFGRHLPSPDEERIAGLRSSPPGTCLRSCGRTYKLRWGRDSELRQDMHRGKLHFFIHLPGWQINVSERCVCAHFRQFIINFNSSSGNQHKFSMDAVTNAFVSAFLWFHYWQIHWCKILRHLFGFFWFKIYPCTYANLGATGQR